MIVLFWTLLQLFITTVAHARTHCVVNIVHRGGASVFQEQDDSLVDAVLREVAQNQDNEQLSVVAFDLKDAYGDFGERGQDAYAFLRGLAASQTFCSEYWQKRPLLLRSPPGKESRSWVSDAFTMDHLKLIDQSYISGYRTSDLLRDGSKTNTWEFVPIKPDLSRPITWQEVEKALEGGTIYFNTAGSLWPNLGGLCRITMAAFGFPANVNVYVTPAAKSLSVPPHTDKQDVFVLQTTGAKRWRIYAPPDRTTPVDPLSRGKAGDILTDEELGEPLLDTIIRKGDIIYVPPGFPHTTDTIILNDDEDDTVERTSLHLTMGLDTHVWGLTLAYLRWSVLNRSNMEYKLDMENDKHYWKSSESMPVGFVGGKCWAKNIKETRHKEVLDKEYCNEVVEKVKNLMVMLEPQRWKTEMSPSGTEEFPPDESFNEVVRYMICDHLKNLLEINAAMYSGIKVQDERTVMKAFEGTKKQNAVMEKFGIFSNSAALRDAFAQRRIQQEEKLAQQ